MEIPYGIVFTLLFRILFKYIWVKIRFTQNTFMGNLNQGQSHDGSVFDEVSLNLTLGFFLLDT